MANEITASGNLILRRDGVTMTVARSTRADQANTGAWAETLLIDTSDTQITPGVESVGWVWLANLDEENYVDWGEYTVAAHYVGRLLPLEHAGPFRLLPDAVLVLKADTAECLVRIVALEV